MGGNGARQMEGDIGAQICASCGGLGRKESWHNYRQEAAGREAEKGPERGLVERGAEKGVAMHLLALLTQLLHLLGETGVFSDEVAHQPRVPVRLLCLRSDVQAQAQAQAQAQGVCASSRRCGRAGDGKVCFIRCRWERGRGLKGVQA